MKLSLFFWGISAFLLSALVAQAEITTGSLLNEMVDLRRLMKFPDPAYATKQFSSYDRASVVASDHDGWFANDDRGKYLRVERVDGRAEHVLMDADGPGAVVRIWSANPGGVLRVYLDGSSTPVIEEEMTSLLGGKLAQFPAPLSGERAKGWNLYFPIAYARHCKITTDRGEFYYHVNYRTYASGTKVRTLTIDELNQVQAQVQEIARRLANPRSGGGPPAERTRRPFEINLAPGASATLWSTNGSLAICGFLVRLHALDMPAAARQLVLSITFDGENTVESPLGDFFGTAPGLISYASLPLGITDSAPADLWCHWWMPFRDAAEVRMRNLGAQSAQISGAVAVVPNAWDDATLHFHAKWRIERALPTRPMTDWPHLACNGKGRFVGGALHVVNPVKGWWGEGDEKIYVDGESFPSHFGTGTEDYYGYAWCSPERFVHPYHNQPNCDGPANYGNTSVNRFHVIDDIPFQSSFKFDIENWHWDPNITTERAAISYWYAQPKSKDFFGPITAADLRYEPVAPWVARRVPGALEIEQLKVLSKTGGSLSLQSYDFMSNEQHLWWTGARPGDRLDIAFDSPGAGSKRIFIRCTKARDYATVRFLVNNEPMGTEVDLFDPHVVGSAEIDLGAANLKAGTNTLTVEIVGANEKAVKAYMAGLDYILLR